MFGQPPDRSDDIWRSSDTEADAEWLTGDYECLRCTKRCDIDGEHKRIAKNWCSSCGKVQPHKRRNKDE